MRIWKNLVRLIILAAGISGSAFAQKVVITWQAPANPPCGPVTSYNVYWSATPGGEVMGTHPLTPNGVTGTTFTDTTVAFGTTREYKLSAYAGGACGGKESVFSAPVSVTIPAQVIIVLPPTGVQAQIVIP